MANILEFCLALLIAGGFIAWLGDRLGTYVGKKRLSRFGLRPKHTAMLYTIVSGSIIALLTLFVLLAYNKEVQQALLQGQKIIADNKRFRKENTRLQLQTKLSQEQRDKALDNVNLARDLEKKLTQELNVTDKKLMASQRAVVEDNRRLLEAKKHLASVQNDLHSTAQDLKEAKANVEDKKRDLDKAQKTVADVRVSYNKIFNQITTMADLEQTLTKHNDDLKSHNKLLEIENKNLLDANKNLQNSNVELANANAELGKQNDILKTKNIDIHRGDVIYMANEPLDKIVLPTNLQQTELLSRINLWLDAINKAAYVNGAAPDNNGRAISVQRFVRSNGDDSQVYMIPENENLNLLTDAITDQKDRIKRVVVVAYSRYNTLKDEVVKIDLNVYEDELKFYKGRIVATTTIDASQPIFVPMELQQFVTRKVQPIAKENDMIPSYDKATKEFIYGRIVNEAEVLAKIASFKGPVYIEAIANDDIYTSGPLLLRISVSPIKDKPKSIGENFPGSRSFVR